VIADPVTRGQFLSKAPPSAVHYFGPGTAFAVRCRGRGLAAPGGALTARGEVELLAIPSDGLAETQQVKSSSAS
jgi:hypothetical protein